MEVDLDLEMVRKPTFFGPWDSLFISFFFFNLKNFELILDMHKNSAGGSLKPFIQLPPRLTSYMTIGHLSKRRN